MIKDNKVIKFIGNLLYFVFFIIVVALLMVVVLQRFSNNAIALGGYRLFTVATGSMVPEYDVGDVLVAKTIKPEDIKIGEAIVYKGSEGSFKDRIVTHEVISVEKIGEHYKIITKGIANEEEDPAINETQVYGEIVYKIETLSFLSKLTTNLYIFYFMVFIPIAIIIFRQIRNIILEDDDNEEEN